MTNTTTIILANIWASISGIVAHALTYVAVKFDIEPQIAEKPVVLEPRRLTVADQWTALVHIIKGAASRTEEATRCHASAAMQLDLAQYALTNLVDELSAVMDLGGRRRRATVHVLEVPPPRAIGDAIAA